MIFPRLTHWYVLDVFANVQDRDLGSVATKVRRIVREIERAFRDAARRVRNTQGQSGSVQFAGRLDYEAFKLPAGDPSVRAAICAIRRLGGEPITAVSNGGLDANWLTHRGIPTVSLGCGQENMHTTDEAVNLPEFRRACDIAMLLATGT